MLIKPATYAYVFLICGIYASALNARELNSEQIKLIRETAAEICNTVKGATGQKTTAEIEGDVKARLGGLVGRLADAGLEGKLQARREAFEGLSQEATATALSGDRQCRERVFNQMFKELSKDNIKQPEQGRATEPADRSPSIPAEPRSKNFSMLGFWAGPVTCQNRQFFSLTIDFVQEFGTSTIGFSKWSGSTSGTDRVTLSLSPSRQDSLTYYLISDKTDTYRYVVQIPNQRLIHGISLGREQCDIRLERM